METEEFFIIGVVLAVIAKVFYDYVYPQFEQTKQSTIRFIYSLNNWKTYMILIILTLPCLIYLNYKMGLKISRKIRQKREEKENKQLERKEIENAIDQGIADFNYGDIVGFIDLLKKKINVVKDNEEFVIFRKALKDKLIEANKIRVEARHKRELYEIKEEKRQLETDIRELERQKRERLREKEQASREILKRLKVEENFVFKKDELTDNEFKVLLENDYQQANQFCVYEQRLITALVKTPLNHSITHTFLVWSIIRLLKIIEGVTDIQVHLTKDADITFRYNGKIFALEVETGTLLEKPTQLKEKVNYLNKRYPNRWMFIVSNKDLIWQYQKLGFSTQRNEVEKNLRKLVEMS